MTPSISTEHKISWKCHMTANIVKIFFWAIQSIMNSPSEEKDNHPAGFTVTALKIED